MSRPYFKNDLYNYTLHFEQKDKKEEADNDKLKLQEEQDNRNKQFRNQQLQKHSKHNSNSQTKSDNKGVANKKIEEAKGKIPIDEDLSISATKSAAFGSQTEGNIDVNQLLKNFCKKSQKKQNKSIFSNSFTPKSNLVVKEIATDQKKTEEELRQQQKNNNIYFHKLQNKLKVTLNNQSNTSTEGSTATNQADPANQADPTNQTDPTKNEDKQQPKVEVADEHKSKTKKIKKQPNYVRLDLKRKYKDRFLGGLNSNLRKYNRNGRLKPKYRMQSELTMEDGQIYNTYITSLSSALCMTIDLNQEESEEIQMQPIQQNANDEHGSGQSSDEDDSDIDVIIKNRQNQANTVKSERKVHKNKKGKYQLPSDWSESALTDYIQRLFGFQYFRQGQFQTINNILNGKSTVFISETASGKSLTYILSALLMKGLSLVISPLVSLMLDQLAHLPDNLPAACISSLLNREQRDRIIKLVHAGKINLLFLTPECLQTDFLYHLQDFPEVNFTCIDEAHSLSELSHNFRTSFLALGQIVQNLIRYKNNTPVILALTATANPEAVRSIQAKLNISQQIRSKSCLNKNLFVTISRQKGQLKYEALIKYLQHEQICKSKGILVYTRTRKIMFQVFNFVTNSTDFKTAIYHSALSNKQKTETLSKFRDGTIKIVIATVALGMGLDFSHLECVIHLNMPKSIENYVQQIGRAGRRQKRAYCHLFLDDNDYFTQRNYIIADELQAATLMLLYQSLKDHSVIAKKRKQKIESYKNRKQQQELAIKRASIIIEQKMRNQIIEEEDCEQSYEQEQKQPQQNHEPIKIKSRFFCIRVQKLTQSTQLREQAILTLLLKIQALLKHEQVSLKVLPIANQSLKLGFFKNNKEQIKSQSQFFRNLISDCKQIKGTIYINIIDKCNELNMKPIFLMTELYRLGNQHWIKIQQQNPIFVWQFSGNQSQTDSGEEEELSQLVKRGFDKLQGSEEVHRVINQMNQVQKTALVKLNTLYSLAFNHSRNNISSVLNNNHLIPPSKPIPNDSISKQFDNYFKDSLQGYYNRITDSGNSIFIPSQMISPKDLQQIYGSVILFFKHELATKDIRNEREANCARRDLINLYQNGKVITKILMGVNSGEVSWKIYGERPYWMRFRHKNYEQLFDCVRIMVQRYEKEYQTQA